MFVFTDCLRLCIRLISHRYFFMAEVCLDLGLREGSKDTQICKLPLWKILDWDAEGTIFRLHPLAPLKFG